MTFAIGDKVQYIGTDSDKYGKKKGWVISEPYTLENTGEMKFIDVEWFYEQPLANDLVSKKHKGHVININNLKAL